MKIVDLKPTNRHRKTAERPSGSFPHTPDDVKVDSDRTVQSSQIAAIKKLGSIAEKIVLHNDGTHGVGRMVSTPEELAARAQSEAFIILDLGHVLRLYFGDDYFDVILSSKIVHQRNPDIDALVKQIQMNNEDMSTL